MVNTTKPQPPTTSSKWQLSPRLLFGITVLLCVSIAFHFALIKGEKVKKKTLGRHEAFITARLIKESLKYTFNNEYVPPWDKKAGLLFYDREFVNPSYKIRYPLNGSVGDYRMGVLVGELENEYGYILKDFPKERRYFYFPYAITNEAEGLALLDVYRKIFKEGGTFENTLPAPKGLGTYGTDHFYRLNPGIHGDISAEKKDIPDNSQVRKEVFMLVERPGNYDTLGGWVVNLEFNKPVWMDYPGEFPMSERFINALEALEQEYNVVTTVEEGG